MGIWSSLFSRRKREQRNRRIEKHMTKSTEKFLLPVFKKANSNKFVSSLLKWSNSNKKKVFVITISFLLSMVVYSFYKAIDRKKKQDIAFEKTKKIMQYNRDRYNNLINNYSKLSTIKDYKIEIERLMSKDSLTEQDSIKIHQLYNSIFEKNKKNEIKD